MIRQSKFSWSQSAVLTALVLCISSSVQALDVMDDFSGVWDYSGGTVDPGNIWDGSHNTANLAGGLFGSNFFANEELYLDDNNVTNVGWEGGRSTAPMLYLDVPAEEDFTAKVKITSQTSGFWSAAGLIARAKQGTPPGSGTDNDDEHFVTMTSFRTNADIPDVGTTLMKRIEDGAQLNDIQVSVDVQSVPNPNYDPNDPNSAEFIDVSLNPVPFWLSLERGRFFNPDTNRFGFGYQGAVSPDGINWQVQSTVFPSDTSPLIDRSVPIEVGLSYMNFGGVSGATTFDDFMLQTRPAAVPEPGSVCLAALAGLGAYVVRRRRKLAVVPTT